MAVREYQFVNGVQTSTIPDPGLAVDDEDIANYGQIQDEFAKRNAWFDKQTTLANLKAIASADRFDGQYVSLKVAGQEPITYWFDSASAETGDDDYIVEPTVGTGRWKRIITSGFGVLDEGTPLAVKKKMDFQGAGVAVTTTADSYVVTIAGGGGGGGGGSSVAAQVQALVDAELSTDQETESKNQFKDDFEENQKVEFDGGTMEQAGSTARFVGSNLTGEFKRDDITATDKEAASGVIVVNLQAYKPNDTTIVVSGDDRTIIFPGDVTGRFPSGKKVLSMYRTPDGDMNSNDQEQFTPLFNSAGDLIKFTVDSAPTYDDGNDETTVVLTSVDATDITWGLSNTEYDENLRFAPFNFIPYFNVADETPTGGDWLEMEITDAWSLAAISINGDDFFELITGDPGTGTVLMNWVDMDRGTNPVYGYRSVLRNNGSNEDWYFFYSKDGGNTWSYHGTKSSGASIVDENGGDFRAINKSGSFVSTSGKVIRPYYKYVGGFNKVYAIYTDLSAGSPTLSDLAGHTGTNSTNTLGEMFGHATNDLVNIGGGHKSGDDSFIAFAAGNVTAGHVQVKMWDFSGATPTYLSASDTGAVGGGTFYDSAPLVVFVSGTGTSHVTHMCGINNATTQFVSRYWNQGSSSANSHTNTGTDSGDRILSFCQNSTYGIVAYRSTNNGSSFKYLTLSGTTWSNQLVLVNDSGMDLSTFMGFSGGGTANPFKTYQRALVTKPSDDEWALFCIEAHTPSVQTILPISFEIPDITSFQGISESQFTATANIGSLRQATSDQQVGQGFRATSTHCKTSAARLVQVGNIAEGSNLWTEIYAATGLNGTVSGPVLATSQMIDPSTISKDSNGQEVMFNYDSFNTVIGSDYVEVLRGDWTIDGSNYLVLRGSTGSSYANGRHQTYNGSIWTLGNAADDLYFWLSGFFARDIGNSVHANVTLKKGITETNEEFQVAHYDSNNVRLSWRKIPHRYNSNNDKPHTGHPWDRLMAWSGSAGVQSTFTDIRQVGYRPSEYDDNRVLSIAFGHIDSADLNLDTGAGQNQYVHDRSGIAIVNSGSTAMSTNTADSDFHKDFCIDANGTTAFASYTGSTALDLSFNKAAAYRFEIKLDSVSNRIYYDNRNTSGQGGAVIHIGQNASGDIDFDVTNSSGTTIGRARTVGGFISASTYYVIEIVLLGTSLAPKIFKATSWEDMYNQTGSYVEATYSTTTAFVSGNSSGITATAYVGRNASGTSFTDGKIGLLLINNGASTFTTGSWVSQPPLVSTQNMGRRIYAKQVIGNNAASIGTNYNYAGYMSPDIASVDSHPMAFAHSSSTLTPGRFMHYKVECERMDATDPSTVEGYIVDFS